MVWRTSVELVDYDLYKVFLVINNTEGLVSFTPVHRRNYIRCNSMFSKASKALLLTPPHFHSLRGDSVVLSTTKNLGKPYTKKERELVSFTPPPDRFWIPSLLL